MEQRRGAKILAKLLGQGTGARKTLMAFSWDLIYICHPTGSRRFLLSLFRSDHAARLHLVRLSQLARVPSPVDFFYFFFF